MNKLVETLIERVADWPQDALAEVVQSIVDIETKHFGVYKLNPEERAAIDEAIEEMRQGRFAADDEVTAVFNRYR
jgi:ABC-type amino acid transport substrate-binding protein